MKDIALALIKKEELNKQIRKEQEDFYKEVEKCKDCKIQRGNKKIIQPEDYCNYHQEIYREMEGYVI